MYGYIYLTTNTINGKKYIGQKAGQWNPDYKGSGVALKSALKKYGKEAFNVELLEIVQTKYEIDNKEIEWISKYNAVEDKSFYNLGIGGKCWNRGIKNPKNSERMKLNNPMKSKEVREKAKETKRKLFESGKYGTTGKPFCKGHSPSNKISEKFTWNCKWCGIEHIDRNTKKLRDAANFCNKSCAASHYNVNVKWKSKITSSSSAS
jgi:hypothetical protein